MQPSCFSQFRLLQVKHGISCVDLVFLAETKKKHNLGKSFIEGCSKHAYSLFQFSYIFIRYTF